MNVEFHSGLFFSSSLAVRHLVGQEREREEKNGIRMRAIEVHIYTRFCILIKYLDMIQSTIKRKMSMRRGDLLNRLRRHQRIIRFFFIRHLFSQHYPRFLSLKTPDDMQALAILIKLC